MANKIFNVKIQNRVDTYENWMANGDMIPLKGEICIMTVTAADGQSQTPPATLIRVGDGVTPFKNLKNLQAEAADVWPWAKAQNPPTVNASDVVGLEDYIGEKVEDTNTTYKIVADEKDPSKLYLQSTEDASAETPTWTTVSTFNLTKVEAGDTAGTIKVNGTDVAITGWSTLQTQVTNNTTAIETLNGADTEEGSVANTVKTATETLKTEIQTEINTKLSSTYHAAGSLAPTALTADLLVKANEGNVYNVNAPFDSSDLFVEGEGKSYPIGTNVVVVEVPDESTGAEEGAVIYKYDVLAGFVNLSDYTTKDEVEEALSGLDLGNIKGTITTEKISDFTTQVETVVKEQLTPVEGEGAEQPEILKTVESIAKEQATEIVNGLDVTDTEEDGKFVVSVSQTDGTVSNVKKSVDIAQLVQNTGDTIVLSCGGATEA